MLRYQRVVCEHLPCEDWTYLKSSSSVEVISASPYEQVISIRDLILLQTSNCGLRLTVSRYPSAHILDLQRLSLTRAFEGFFPVCLNLSFRGRQSTVSMVFHAL